MVMDLSPRSALNPHHLREFKLVVVGPRKVGKSALVVRFLTRRFINEYLENADMTCNGSASVDGESLRVTIQDTSDKGMRLASIDHHFRWAEAIMLVYSTTDPEGFRQLKDTATKIADKMGDMDDKELSRVPPFVLVANKCDLDFPRKVSRQEGFELAEQLRCDFYESSAREGWSKLITRIRTPTNHIPPSSEILGTFASSATAIGVGLVPQLVVPPTTDQSAPAHKGHHRSNSSSGVTGEGNPLLPRVSIISAPKSDSGTPSHSEEEGDDLRCSSSVMRLALPKKSRFGHSRIIGKLSPRLGRKFSSFREPKSKLLLRNNNVNNGQRNLNNNNIMSGLSSALIVAGSPVCQEIQSPTSSEGNDSSRTTSAAGSTESLNLVGLENDVTTPPSSAHARSKGVECFACQLNLKEKEYVLREHEFCTSEPFLQLCRDGRTQKIRTRARSPSNLLRSGFKRIRSLTTETPNALKAQQN